MRNDTTSGCLFDFMSRLRINGQTMWSARSSRRLVIAVTSAAAFAIGAPVLTVEARTQVLCKWARQVYRESKKNASVMKRRRFKEPGGLPTTGPDEKETLHNKQVLSLLPKMIGTEMYSRQLITAQQKICKTPKSFAGKAKVRRDGNAMRRKWEKEKVVIHDMKRGRH